MVISQLTVTVNSLATVRDDPTDDVHAVVEKILFLKSDESFNEARARPSLPHGGKLRPDDFFVHRPLSVNNKKRERTHGSHAPITHANVAVELHNIFQPVQKEGL